MRKESRKNRRKPRMPAGSLLYEKVVPILLILLTVALLLLVLAALGFLFGVIPSG